MRVKEGNKERDIYEAAIKVFAKNGYHNAKIADIAELAGVATGSVYLYFKNKEDLLISIFDNLWKIMYENSVFLRDNNKFSPAEKLDRMLNSIFDIYIKFPNLAILMINENDTYLSFNKNQNSKYYDEFFQTASEIFNEGVKDKSFTSEVNFEFFKSIIIGSFRELLGNWVTNKKTVKLEEIRSAYKYVMKYGIMRD